MSVEVIVAMIYGGHTAVFVVFVGFAVLGHFKIDVFPGTGK